MIIDIRNRPPFQGIAEHYLFTASRRQMFAGRFGLSIPVSVMEKSMTHYLAEMDSAGIDKAVVPLRKYPAGGPKGMDNQDLVELLAQYPQRFIGFAGIDPLDGTQALAEIQKFVQAGPCRGILLEPGYCQEPLYITDERIYPIYERCQQEKIPVLLSFGGFVAPDSSYNQPQLVNQVAKDFPKLHLTLAHGGWPFAQEMCHIAFNWENVYLSPDIYAVNVPGCQDFLAAANYFVPDKIIFGSAYPVLSMGDTVAYYLEHLHPEHRDQVMYQNALKFLGMEEEQYALEKNL